MITDILQPIVLPGGSKTEQLLAAMKAGSFGPKDSATSLRVGIAREPFDDYYTLLIDDGAEFPSQEFDAWGLREWLELRGWPEDDACKVIDQAFNFYISVAEINKPKALPKNQDPNGPDIGLVM